MATFFPNLKFLNQNLPYLLNNSDKICQNNLQVQLNTSKHKNENVRQLKKTNTRRDD